MTASAIQGRVLVTGPDGFVGMALCRELVRRGYAVRGAQWKPARLPSGCEAAIVGEIGAQTDWGAALQGVDRVVHLAARVHIMDDRAVDPLAEFRRVNVDGTRSLAKAAAKAGVRRLVLMSTIKVNGEKTEFGAAFSEQNLPVPKDSYGISKQEAERALQDIGARAGLETVIIRSPLVYGPGVKGNFLSLMKLARTGLPLPLGALCNRRSLVYLGNLVDFIIRCLDHPAAANELFLISDGMDLSTPELLRGIRIALGKSPRLWPVPPALFHQVGRLTGRTAVVDRLCASLQVDSGKARKILGWKPLFTVQEGLLQTAKDFISQGI
jgi:nucleoside-diphosphate-sugar epimerase